MKEKVRFVSLIVVDAFMIFCLFFAIFARKNMPATVMSAFGIAFTSYLIISILIPNRAKEYSQYKKIYAPHLAGIFKGDNRRFTSLLKMISCLYNEVNPKIGIIYSSKLLSNSETDRERAVVNYFCGACCANASDNAKARDYFQNAVNLDTSYIQAYLRLSVASLGIGDKEGAAAALDKAVSLIDEGGDDIVPVIDSARLTEENYAVLYAEFPKEKVDKVKEKQSTI